MRLEKKLLVQEVSTTLTESAFLYFVSFKGLNVQSFNSFRDELAKNDATCTVLKNRLIVKAAEAAELTDLAGIDLKGDTAMVSGTGDAGAVAKVISTFAKDNKELAAKAGYLEGEVLDQAGVTAIADLPPKEVLQAMLLSTLLAPATNLVGVLNNAGAQIVNVLSNFKDSK